MISVGIHPPKTPVTKGSLGTAKATLPNVCKMPGPPAPFVPSPLPNLAKSGSSPKDFSTTVKIEGNTVAIRGATFESMGDMASKGTGGGLISANTHGPAKFITPGSLTVKIEGKAVHLLSEPMLNNCGASGSPPNTGATMVGLDQDEQKKWDDKLQKYVNECDKEEDDKYRPDPSDCDAPCQPPETMKNDAGDIVPKPVKVKLGELKEKCVYKKMGFTEDPQTKKYETQSNSAPNGNSVTIQQRFTAGGAAVAAKAFGGAGSIVPDVLYKGADGEIACIRDLKFRCPKGVKTTKQDTEQLKKYRRILGKAAEIIQPR
jgi:hypothetical protein